MYVPLHNQILHVTQLAVLIDQINYPNLLPPCSGDKGQTSFITSASGHSFGHVTVHAQISVFVNYVTDKFGQFQITKLDFPLQ